MTVTAAPARKLQRLDELLGREVSLRALQVLRILAGPIVLLHLWPFLSDAVRGRIYSDHFYEPYAAWYPELPRGAYVAVLFLGALGAAAMTLQLAPRAATVTTFGVVAYNLFLSTTHFHNNRAYLVVVLGILALAPSAPRGPAWPLWLLRFECAAIYGASGLSKLLDPDWFGGTVTWQRVVQARDELHWLPNRVVSLLTDRDIHTGAAKLIVLTELFIATGLWWRRTRYAAVWVAVVFHVTIEASAAVQVFSLLGVAVLLVWATPSTRDRAVRTRHPWLRRLDWMQRFRVERGDGLEVVDRDGTILHGARAKALLLSRLPLTAWFGLPTQLLRR